jgi:hypothetical protein
MPDEDYSKNVSCALYSISEILLGDIKTKLDIIFHNVSNISDDFCLGKKKSHS